MRAISSRFVAIVLAVCGFWAVSASAGLPPVGAGSLHSLFLADDGKLYAWGNNAWGQLGDNTKTERASPVLVILPAGVTKFTGVGTGWFHSFAVGDDGNLYAWGKNVHGQLGDGTSTQRSVPTLVTLPAGVAVDTVVGGAAHSLVLATDGRLFAWGDNSTGQLGDGTTAGRVSPVPIPFPAGVTAFSVIAAGAQHSGAIGDDGKGYAWGYNSFGQLCDGTTTTRTTPTAIPGTGPGTVIPVWMAAGESHSLALGNNGRLYACGANNLGQLGDGSHTHRASRVQVLFPPGIGAFTWVRSRGNHSVAQGDNGEMYAWGNNSRGQLGDGTTTARSMPVRVPLPTGVSGLAAGRVGYEHTLAWADGAKIYAWGSNEYYQLGNGGALSQPSPVRVTGLPVYLTMGAGTYGTVTGSTWTTSMKPRAWAHALVEPAANLPFPTDIGTTIDDWWGHDGVYQYSASNSTLGVIGMGLGVGTDATGSLTGGWFELITPQVPHSVGQTVHGMTFHSGIGLVESYEGQCAATSSGECTNVSPKTASATVTNLTTVGASVLQCQPAARMSFKSPAVKVSEGAANAVIVVQRGGTGWGSLSVDYATADGTAVAGSDYTAKSGTLTWADGNRADKTISVPITSDGTTESTEAFTVTLSNPTNNLAPASFGTTRTTTVTIIDNDPAVPFADVPGTSFALSHINSLAGAGITTGCGGGNYCPTNNVTREQMAAFLVRAVEGEPATDYCGTTDPFTDVPYSNPMCRYVKRLYQMGITTGCGGGNYCPANNVTREQMAAFIIRALEGNPAAGYCGSTAPFADVPTTNAFCGHIKRMQERGVTTGCGNGNYCPAALVTREQMAAFLGRAFLGM